MRINVKVMLDVVDLTCDWKKRGLGADDLCCGMFCFE